MKSKPKPTAEAIWRDLQLRKQLHQLIDDIVAYCEEPCLWPLSPLEQINFIRMVTLTARKIRNTEAYLAEGVMIAAEALKP